VTDAERLRKCYIDLYLVMDREPTMRRKLWPILMELGVTLPSEGTQGHTPDWFLELLREMGR
jgi:hypothetical protein